MTSFSSDEDVPSDPRPDSTPLDMDVDFEQKPSGDRTYDDSISSPTSEPPSAIRLLLVISLNKKSGSSAAPKTSGKDGCLPNIGGEGELVNQGSVVGLLAASKFNELSTGFVIFLVFLWTNEPITLLCGIEDLFLQWFSPSCRLLAVILSNVSKLLRVGATGERIFSTAVVELSVTDTSLPFG